MLYVLSVYSENIEPRGTTYWSFSRISKLLKYLEQQWEWIQDCEYQIYIAKLDSAETQIIDLIPEDPRNFCDDEFRLSSTYNVYLSEAILQKSENPQNAAKERIIEEWEEGGSDRLEFHGQVGFQMQHTNWYSSGR